MKKQYIHQVKKQLSVSRQAKKEIVRDLEEVFASALEHGESETQVMERLGSPKDFVENMEEQLRLDWAGYRNRKKLIQIVCSFAAALAFFVLYIVVRALQLPENIIGQADSMTGIKIETPFVLNCSMSFIVILGIAALIVGIVLTIKYINTRYENRRDT